MDGELTVTDSTYINASCAGAPALVDITTGDYVLGDAVTPENTVPGITTATEIDITNTTSGDPDEGRILYDIVARNGGTAYIGEANGDDDGTSPSRRHKRLDADFPLTEQ